MSDGRIKPADPDPPLNDWTRKGMLVQTPNGEVIAMPGDWLIKDSDGGLHACKAVNFERTYDLPPPMQGKRADYVIMDDLDETP